MINLKNPLALALALALNSILMKGNGTGKKWAMGQSRGQEGSGIIGLDRGRVQKRRFQSHFQPVWGDAW